MPRINLPEFSPHFPAKNRSIAFAVRCARRVEPLLSFFGSLTHGTRDYEQCFVKVVGHAERCAEGNDLGSKILVEKYQLEDGLGDVASGARIALRTAIGASRAVDEHRWKASWSAAMGVALLANDVGELLRLDLSAEIAADHKRAMYDPMLSGYGKDDTPVYQAEFGLMWPNGIPDLFRAGLHLPAIEKAGSARAGGVQEESGPTALERGIIMRDFREAIANYFSHSELEQLLRFRFDVRLDGIVKGDSFEQVAFKTIEWSRERGLITDLADMILSERPKVKQVTDACEAVIRAGFDFQLARRPASSQQMHATLQDGDDEDDDE